MIPNGFPLPQEVKANKYRNVLTQLFRNLCIQLLAKLGQKGYIWKSCMKSHRLDIQLLQTMWIKENLSLKLL